MTELQLNNFNSNFTHRKTLNNDSKLYAVVPAGAFLLFHGVNQLRHDGQITSHEKQRTRIFMMATCVVKQFDHQQFTKSFIETCV